MHNFEKLNLFELLQGETTLNIIIKRQCPFISCCPSGWFLFSFKLILLALFDCNVSWKEQISLYYILNTLIHFTLKYHNDLLIWWFDCLDNYILSYKAPHELSWTLLSWIVINPVNGTSSNKKGWIWLDISIVEGYDIVAVW